MLSARLRSASARARCVVERATRDAGVDAARPAAFAITLICLIDVCFDDSSPRLRRR